MNNYDQSNFQGRAPMPVPPFENSDNFQKVTDSHSAMETANNLMKTNNSLAQTPNNLAQTTQLNILPEATQTLDIPQTINQEFSSPSSTVSHLAPGTYGTVEFMSPGETSFGVSDYDSQFKSSFTSDCGNGQNIESKNSKKHKPRKTGLLVGGALLLGAILGGAGSGWLVSQQVHDSTTNQLTAPLNPVTVVKNSSVENPNWTEVAKAVSGSVVSINVTTSNKSGAGSGVIFDSNGHIVTNYHVIEGGKQIVVTIANGELYEATVKGSDPSTDLAVLELKGLKRKLTPAQFATTSTLQVGDPVAAFGNPLGISHTLTTGIVSALERPVVTDSESEEEQPNQFPNQPNNPFRLFPEFGNDDDGSENNGGLKNSSPGTDKDLNQGKSGSGSAQTQTSGLDSVATMAIQVDASINPGNSGGPLFDVKGNVVGITSSIATLKQNSGSVGLGFAIPSPLVVNVVKQLIATGKAEHAYLGVIAGAAVVNANGVTVRGSKLMEVQPNTPAAQAGLRANDVIVKLNGESVISQSALTAMVRTFKKGDKIKLTYVRDGKVRDVTVTLEARP